VQVHSTGDSRFTAYRWSNDLGGSALTMFKSRGTAIGTRGLVLNGDTLGTITFAGDDGTNAPTAASIRAVVDGTSGAGDLPGRLDFGTTADGASAVTQRWSIYSTGILAPFADNTYSLGTASLRMSDVHSVLGTFGSQVLVGHTAAVPIGPTNATTPQLQVHGTGNTSQAVYRWSNDSNSAGFDLFKSRGATAGTRGIVQSGDVLGLLSWRADDGTNGPTAAYIRALVDGTPGAGDMPGRLEFGTTPDGSTATAVRWSIYSTGHMAPFVDNTYSLGTASLRASSVHAVLGNFYGSIVQNLNAGAVPTAPAGTTFHMFGADASAAGLTFDTVGGNGVFNFRRAQGTNASKTALTTGAQMGNIRAWGYGATGYSGGQRAQMAFFASENWSDTVQGTNWALATTPIGSTTLTNRLIVDADGAGSVTPGADNTQKLGTSALRWSEVHAGNGVFTGYVKSGAYTVATVPSASAAGAGARIYVTDESGGAVGAESDGTDWRRVTDRAIIS
jgi:hypothetical protein